MVHKLVCFIFVEISCKKVYNRERQTELAHTANGFQRLMVWLSRMLAKRVKSRP